MSKLLDVVWFSYRNKLSKEQDEREVKRHRQNGAHTFNYKGALTTLMCEAQQEVDEATALTANKKKQNGSTFGTWIWNTVSENKSKTKQVKIKQCNKKM